jgi:hypothetical protein
MQELTILLLAGPVSRALPQSKPEGSRKSSPMRVAGEHVGEGAEVRVRTLGEAVSEHFVLLAVARCAFVGRRGDSCGLDAGLLRGDSR